MDIIVIRRHHQRGHGGVGIAALGVDLHDGGGRAVGPLDQVKAGVEALTLMGASVLLGVARRWSPLAVGLAVDALDSVDLFLG